MNIVFLQHHPNMGPGKFKEFLDARAGVCCKVIDGTEPKGFAIAQSADLVVSLGSCASVYDTSTEWVNEQRELIRERLAKAYPVIGICFGAQMIASLLGADVRGIGRSYAGWITNDHAIHDVWVGPWFRFHREHCIFPDDFGGTILAKSEGTIQAFRHGAALGVQFHPEVDSESIQHLGPEMCRDLGIEKNVSRQIAGQAERMVTSTARACDKLFEEMMSSIYL